MSFTLFAETPQHCSHEIRENAHRDKWSLEQMNGFRVKLGFIQCELQESKDSPSVHDFHRVYEVGCTL